MKDSEFQEKQKQLIALCPEVDGIAFALKNYLQVTFFRYVKSYPNHEKYILCNSEPWLKAYFKEKFYNIELADYSKHPEDSRGLHVHHPCGTDHPVCNFWNKHAVDGDYDAFVYFFAKYKNYFESYNFGLKGDFHVTNDTILNNQHLFKHFFLYFKSKGQSLLKQGEALKFMTEPSSNFSVDDNWLVGKNKQLSKIVIMEMPLQEFVLDGELEDISFTLKEARSLYYFLEGYGNQKSSELLLITEKQHLENLASVLEKLKISNYMELRTLCSKLHIARKLKSLRMDVVT